MQFNREEYLKGNFDTTSQEERKNAYYATKLIGLSWNNYIKDYFKDCMGDAIGTFEYNYQLVMPFATAGVLVDFGLFKQAAEYLQSLKSDNIEFNANKNLWIERLLSADDHYYQKEHNPDYITFTEKSMAEKDIPKEEIILDLAKNEENNIENSEIQENKRINSVLINQEIDENASNNGEIIEGTDD